MSQTENKNKKMAETSRSNFKIDNIIIGIRRFGWICVVLAILFGSVSFVREYVRYTPKYTSEATFTVNTQNSSSSIGGVSVYSFYYDAATANQLTETFPIILGSNLLHNAICEDLDITYIPVTFHANPVDGSNMFTLSATSTDPQLAYDVLLSAIDNYPTIAQYAIGNIKIEMITAPVVPTEPSNTMNYMRSVLKTMIIGFGIGCLFILIYAYSRNTIRTKNDVKTNLGCELIGVIPLVGFKKHTKEIDRSILCTNEKIDDGFLESMRVLKNVFKNSLKRNEKIIIGTSTAPGEGKTTVITNLALSMVEHGKKILLVDGDVRRLSIAPLLGINPDNIEYETVTEDYKIAHLKDYGIYFMTFSTPEEGKFKYVNSSFIKGVFDSIRDDFDLILVDTPPCGLVSDALFYAQVADAAYYVVLQDTVRVSKIQNGFNNLLGTDVNVLGCILNGASSAHSGYGYGYKTYGRYGYGYGFGYGYGYGYGHEKNKKRR